MNLDLPFRLNTLRTTTLGRITTLSKTWMSVKRLRPSHLGSNCLPGNVTTFGARQWTS